MKSIKTSKANGKVRTFETIATLAINNAFSEKLPFTTLDTFGIKCRTTTHNFAK